MEETMDEVAEWLKKEDLSDLIEIFINIRNIYNRNNVILIFPRYL